MKTGVLMSTLLLVVFGLCSTCVAENWQQFFVNQTGYAFFFDKDSIAYPDKNTVQVWYKSGFPTDVAEIKVLIEWLELREVDCTRRRSKPFKAECFMKTNRWKC